MDRREPSQGPSEGRGGRLPRRPWFLTVAIVLAWLFGVGGCTQGTAVIGSYWSPLPEIAEVASKAPTEVERKVLEAAATRCFTATDRAKNRNFPFGVASFVLGTAMVILAARALGGRSSARSLLVQVVLAQAVFVLLRDWFLRDLPADCLDYFREVTRIDLQAHHADPTTLDRLMPDIRATTVVVSAIRALAAVLIVIGLSLPRSLAYYTAVERTRGEAG